MVEIINSTIHAVKTTFFKTFVQMLETDIHLLGKDLLELKFNDFILQPIGVQFGVKSMKFQRLTEDNDKIKLRTHLIPTSLETPLKCDFNIEFLYTSNPIFICFENGCYGETNFIPKNTKFTVKCENEAEAELLIYL